MIDLANSTENSTIIFESNDLINNNSKCVNIPTFDFKLSISEGYTRQFLGKIFQYEFNYYR